MTGIERRVNTRVPAEFKVSYVHDGDYLISKTRDISIDGMFIYTENPPPVGDCPKLTFCLNNNEITIKTEVVWTNTSGSEIDTGMGVRFLDASTETRQAILKIVKRVAVLNES